MDPIIAYLLIKNINKQNFKNNIPLVNREKGNNIRISCSHCGQNTYWCQCQEKNIQEKNDSSELLSAGLRLSTMALSSSYE